MKGISPISRAALGAARHRPAVVQHILHGDRQGVGIAQHHHTQRIAHQDDIDSRLVDGQGGRIIVGGEHGDGFAALLLAAQRQRRDFFSSLGKIGWNS